MQNNLNSPKKKHEFGSYMKSIALKKGLSSSQVMDKFNQAARSSLGELGDYNETIQSDTSSEISTKITIIQGDIDDLNAGYFYRHAELKGELNAKYAIEVENERKELRKVLNEYYSNVISKTNLGEQLGELREKYTPIKESILKENAKTLTEYEKNYMDNVQYRIDRINNDETLSSLIMAVWDSQSHSVELVRR